MSIPSGAYGIDLVEARKLRLDDIIIEGRSRRIVRKVEVNPIRCKGHTHINDDWCYDNGQTVETLVLPNET